MFKRLLSIIISAVISITGISPAIFEALPIREPMTFYIDSVNGDDSNPGTIEEPLRSADILKFLRLQKGDQVLFHTGSVFRSKFRCVYGVRYASYGEGEKPTFLGSEDGSDSEKWKKTDTENVWTFDAKFKDDVGNIIFDNGSKCAVKIAGSKNQVGTVNDLVSDLQFLYDNKKIYLYSEENPAERFESIEIATYGHIITLASKCTVEGLKLLYGGSHGIQGKSVHDVVVRDCEIGYMGGCRPEKDRNRLGNGVELWKGAMNVLVENCNVYQIYDAGLTFQSDNGIFKDIVFRNNEVYRCTYGFEYFNGDRGILKNISIEGNEFYYSGYGWGNQRPDPVHTSAVNSWKSHENRFENFKMTGNTFAGSTYSLLIIVSTIGVIPEMEGNTYMQYHKDCMLTPEMKFGKDEAREYIESIDPTGVMKYCHNPMS